MLDARGVISVTERQSYILRVRELRRRAAKRGLEPKQRCDMSEHLTLAARSRSEVAVEAPGTGGALREVQNNRICDVRIGLGFSPLEFKAETSGSDGVMHLKAHRHAAGLRRQP